MLTELHYSLLISPNLRCLSLVSAKKKASSREKVSTKETVSARKKVSAREKVSASVLGERHAEDEEGVHHLCPNL
jgi:hypothetical protein